MQKGSLVERGSTDSVFENPQTEYTRQLLAAIPTERVTAAHGRLSGDRSHGQLRRAGRNGQSARCHDPRGTGRSIIRGAVSSGAPTVRPGDPAPG